MEIKLEDLLNLKASQELARRRLRDFVKLTSPTFEEFSYHKILFQKIQDFVLKIERGETPKLFIGLPPRHFKTETCIRTAVWALARNPSWQVLFIGHNADLPARSCRKARGIAREFGSDYDLYVSTERESAIEWDTTKGGVVKSAGTGGGVTGFGFNLLILDDPIKGVEQAFSRNFRDKQYDWYRSEIETRRQILPKPVHGTLLVMARWHKDDIAGRLLNEEADEWDQLILPAYNDKTGKWLEDNLETELATVRERGGWVWRSLYQQSPSDEEGNIFKRSWWRFYTELPDRFDTIIQSWDTSMTDSDKSDFVSCGIWGCKGADRYLIDLFNKRMSFLETIKEFRRISLQYPKATRKIVENKASGPAVIDVLKREIQGIIAFNPGGDKIQRAMAVQPQIESGNVYLPANAVWINDYLDQCSDFPNTDHDDMVDQMTQALLYLSTNAGVVMTQPKLYEERAWH